MGCKTRPPHFHWDLRFLCSCCAGITLGVAFSGDICVSFFGCCSIRLHLGRSIQLTIHNSKGRENLFHTRSSSQVPEYHGQLISQPLVGLPLSFFLSHFSQLSWLAFFPPKNCTLGPFSKNEPPSRRFSQQQQNRPLPPLGRTTWQFQPYCSLLLSLLLLLLLHQTVASNLRPPS